MSSTSSPRRSARCSPSGNWPGRSRPRPPGWSRQPSWPTWARPEGTPIPLSTSRTPIVGGQRPLQGAWPASRRCCAPCCRPCPSEGQQKEQPMGDLFTLTALSIVVAGLVVGFVVGLTGMGGGALMTPALIFLGVGGGEAATIVTADLTAAAVYKTGGALTHAREGSPNFSLAKWLILGSVPMAFIGPWAVHRVATDEEHLDVLLKEMIGFALLFAAATYALRLYINLRRIRGGAPQADPDPHIRPLATLLVGALGGLLVGVSSVGSGSVIMIALLMLYPGLSAVRLVGTDLGQAGPLVLSAAISNILVNNGVDWSITIPLIVGSVPGTIMGSAVAPRVPQSVIRRGIVVVLTMSGIALLDKAGWGPLGKDTTHPVLIGLVGLAMIVLVPLVWGLLRRQQGLPMFGAPTVAELEGEEQRPRRHQ